MRIPIRLKLAGALAVPMVALIGVAGYEVTQADAKADEVSGDAQLASAAIGPGSLISRLQDERNFTGTWLIGMEGQLASPVSSLEEARTNTDATQADLEAFVAGSGGEIAEIFGPGLEAVTAQLTALRADIDGFTGARTLENRQMTADTVARYTTIIRTLVDGTGAIAFEVDDADLRTGVELINLGILNSEQAVAVLQTVMRPQLTGINDIGVRTEAASLVADFRSQQAAMLARSRGPFAGILEAFVNGEFNQGQLALYDLFIADGSLDVNTALEISNGAMDQVTTALRTPVATALQARADELVDDATTQRQTMLLLASTMVGLALLATVMASRSITNPLRSLTRQAREMATNRLPSAVQQVLDTPAGEDVVVPEVEPIFVKTRDEVANVAEALNTVQSSALDLAVEQAALRKNIADSFVNLGRRNQNLVDRQLEFITDLERQEQEPERLEGLFRLDHLATRMRRNAESLLRLAGGGDTTNTGWGGPVPMVDVVRGALGEVEEYDRVDVRGLEPAVVSAAAGSDLAHALAELVENALHFSPPNERVQVRGRRGQGGSYVLAVIDQGMGMSPEQLETANRRLAGEESFTVAPSRYLGHYVAGHLAATLGLTITLAQEAVGGIIARIDVPAHLLVEGPLARVDESRARVIAPIEYEPEPLRTGPLPLESAPEPEPVVEDATPAEALLTPAPAAEPAPAPLPMREPEPFRTPAPAPLEPMAGGLARRVRGANTPMATNVADAFGGRIPAEEQRPMVTSADDVGSFLSAFTGGVERGRSVGQDEEDTL